MGTNFYVPKSGYQSQKRPVLLPHLKYLILETPYTFFSLHSVGISVLCTLNALSPVFSGINNNKLFSFCLKDMEKML